MSESVSKAAEARRESDWEKNRKALSPNKGKTQNPNTNCGRQEQRETSIGKGKTNRGLNQDAGAVHESEAVPDRPMQYTKPQFKRAHESFDPEASKGTEKNRSTKETFAAERHVTSEPGLDVAKRRSGSVRSNRAETEKVFDSRRKKSSSV